MGSFGKGSLQKIFRKFPRNFRTLSWRNKTHFCAHFREFSAEFPQTFRKNPFANDPISELLRLIFSAVTVKGGMVRDALWAVAIARGGGKGCKGGGCRGQKGGGKGGNQNSGNMATVDLTPTIELSSRVGMALDALVALGTHMCSDIPSFSKSFHV